MNDACKVLREETEVNERMPLTHDESKWIEYSPFIFGKITEDMVVVPTDPDGVNGLLTLPDSDTAE